MEMKPTHTAVKLQLDDIHQPIEQVNPVNNQFAPSARSATNEVSFIDQIEAMRRHMSQAKIEFQQNMNNEELSPQKLMQVQWSLMRITLQEELIAKTAGKVTQSMETLLKAQ